MPRLRRRRAGRDPAARPVLGFPMPAMSSGQPPRCVPPAIDSDSKAAGSAEGGSLSLFGNIHHPGRRKAVFLYTVWIHPLKKIISQFAVKAPRPGVLPFLPLSRASSDTQTLRPWFFKLTVSCRCEAVFRSIMCGYNHPPQRRRAYPVKMTG